MACKRCSQRLTRHHDEMKCVSCGFSIEIDAAQIPAMAIPYSVPYRGVYEALQGRMLTYKFRRVQRQHTLPNMDADLFFVPCMFVICPFCGEEVATSRANQRSGLQLDKSMGNIPVKITTTACSQMHYMRLLSDSSGEFIGWE